MQKELKAIEAAGIQVVGISYDSVAILKTYSEKSGVVFPLLSDPESRTIIAYALRNTETKGQKFGRVNLDGIPYPGTILLDQTGTVRAKLFLEGYKDRHEPQELIKAAKEWIGK